MRSQRKKVPPRALFQAEQAEQVEQAEQADEVIALRVTETSGPDGGGKSESTGAEDRCGIATILIFSVKFRPIRHPELAKNTPTQPLS
jgi:hypothetical protein